MWVYMHGWVCVCQGQGGFYHLPELGGIVNWRVAMNIEQSLPYISGQPQCDCGICHLA